VVLGVYERRIEFQFGRTDWQGLASGSPLPHLRNAHSILYRLLPAMTRLWICWSHSLRNNGVWRDFGDVSLMIAISSSVSDGFPFFFLSMNDDFWQETLGPLTMPMHERDRSLNARHDSVGARRWPCLAPVQKDLMMVSMPPQTRNDAISQKPPAIHVPNYWHKHHDEYMSCEEGQIELHITRRQDRCSEAGRSHRLHRAPQSPWFLVSYRSESCAGRDDAAKGEFKQQIFEDVFGQDGGGFCGAMSDGGLRMGIRFWLCRARFDGWVRFMDLWFRCWSSYYFRGVDWFRRVWRLWWLMAVRRVCNGRESCCSSAVLGEG